MKKLTLILIVMLLLTSLSAIAYAGNTYDVEELNFSVESPEEWIVITRNPEENAEAEKRLDVDSDTLINFLTQGSIYINFVSPSGLEEIVVTMVENDDSHDLVSVNQLSDSQLNQIAEATMGMTIEDVEKNAEELSFEGILPNEAKWTGYSIYEHEQVKFLKMYHTKELDGIQFKGVQYYTIQNGHMINITLTAYSGEIDESLETIIKDVVDSIEFTKLAEGKKPIDLYNIVKYVALTICILSIIVLTPTFLKIRKQKKQENIAPENNDLL